MINSQKIFLTVYFIVALTLAPINLLSFDTFYYWEWSRHLALSYFDGSPLIAYFIKLFTFLLGDTLFALSLIGILTAALVSILLFKTARLFLAKEASYVVVSLWLFSPLTTINLLKQTTYNTPLDLFWTLSLYLSARFIKTGKKPYLYYLGVSIGLMMLSKYSGIIFILGLLIFLFSTNYRYLCKTFTFYQVILIAAFIFSPVLLWNYQHQWQSFLYQLNTHVDPQRINPLLRMIKSFFITFLPALNFMLIPPLICWYKLKPFSKENTEGKSVESDKHIVNLCRIIGTTFLCFYLFTASKASIRESWLAPYLITSALLGGFCYEKFGLKKFLSYLIGGYFIITLSIIINNNYQFSLTTSKKLIYYRLIQQFNLLYPTPPKVIITTGWFEARMLFFLKNKPSIYTLDCGSSQNQYAMWSENMVQQIKNKKVKEAMYIDSIDRSSCIATYFDQCEKLPTKPYPYKKQEYVIYAYKCINNT